MTRSRKSINQAHIDNINRLKAEALALKPSARLKKLKALLINELSTQKEADWDLKDSMGEVTVDQEDRKISYSVSRLLCVSDNNETERQERFAKKWGGSALSAFPYHWHEFLAEFIEAMPCSYGGRVVIEYKAEVEADDFKNEKEIWTEDNLCKVFIHYLASIPDKLFVTLPSLHELISSYDEIEHIKRNVIPNLPFINQGQLAEKFREKSVMFLSLRYGCKLSYEISPDVKAIYNSWAQFHEKAKADKVNGKELERRVFAEWRQKLYIVDEALKQNKETNQFFQRYCEAVEVLQTEYNNTKELIEKNKIVREPLSYISIGAGIGILLGAIIAISVVVSFGAMAPLLIGMIGLVIGAGTLGGFLGNRYKRTLEIVDQINATIEDSSETTNENPAPSAGPTSTAICAIFFGLTSCFSVIPDVFAQTTPTEQQIPQDDQADPTEEVELVSIPKVGK